MKVKKLIFAIIFGIIITFGVGIYSESVMGDLRQNLIRLHVVADSNEAVDQNIKLKIRDRIIKEYANELELSSDIQSTKEIIAMLLPEIEQTANDELKKADMPYHAKVYFEPSDFPTKKYGNLTLPAGEYDALKVVLGSGAGENWWCVMFPPLCFVDGSTGKMSEESMDKLKASVSPEEYELITNQDSEEIPVQIKFKLVEVWQQSKLKIQSAFNKD